MNKKTTKKKTQLNLNEQFDVYNKYAMRVLLVILALTSAFGLFQFGQNSSPVTLQVTSVRTDYQRYIVAIFTDKKGDKAKNGFGTGFLFKTNSSFYILTNQHICENEPHVRVGVLSEKSFIKRRVLDTNLEGDVCIIEGLPGQSIGLELGDEATRGTPVAQIGFTDGNPLSVDLGEYLGETPKFIHHAIPPKKLNHPEVNPHDICYAPNQLHEHQRRNVFGGITKSFSCLKPTNLVVTSMTNAPGGSGSPIINLKTGKIISIAAMIYGNLSRSHGSSYKLLSEFLKLY